MAITVEVPFEVLRWGDVVATGVVDGDELWLAPGSYRVRVLAGSAAGEYPVEVTPAEPATVPVP